MNDRRVPNPAALAPLTICVALALFLIASLSTPATPRLHISSLGDTSSAQQSFVNVEAFVENLKHLRANIVDADNSSKQLGVILSKLPTSWNVQTPEGNCRIDAAPLRDNLASAIRNYKSRAASRTEATEWIDDLTAQLENYPTASRIDRNQATVALQKILKEREFGGSTRQSTLDSIRERINHYIERFLEDLVERMGRHPIGAKLILWLILAISAAWLVTALVRLWQRRIKIQQAWVPASVVPRLSAQEWVRRGREASDRGDFREAIRCVYWAGIVHLQTTGLLQEDLTRTPREYLRDLTGPKASEKQLPLRQLTKQLERIWYGLFPAGSDEFQGCMRNLRDLGYPLP